MIVELKRGRFMYNCKEKSYSKWLACLSLFKWISGFISMVQFWLIDYRGVLDGIFNWGVGDPCIEYMLGFLLIEVISQRLAR